MRGRRGAAARGELASQSTHCRLLSDPGPCPRRPDHHSRPDPDRHRIPARRVRGAGADRRGRHGDGLSRARYEPPSSGRDQVSLGSARRPGCAPPVPNAKRKWHRPFGVVLYELLAGHGPFAGASDLDVWHAIIDRPAPPLPDNVPLPLRMVVEKALEKDRTDRFQSMRDMVVDLRRLLRQSAEAKTGSAAIPRPASRRQWQATAAALLVPAAVGVLYVSRARQPAAPARLAYTQLTAISTRFQCPDRRSGSEITAREPCRYCAAWQPS